MRIICIGYRDENGQVVVNFYQSSEEGDTTFEVGQDCNLVKSGVTLLWNGDQVDGVQVGEENGDWYSFYEILNVMSE